MASSIVLWKGLSRVRLAIGSWARLVCLGDVGGVRGIGHGRGSGCGGPPTGRSFRHRSLLIMARDVVGSPCVPARRRMRDLRKLFRGPSIFQTLSPFTFLPRKICCLVWPGAVYAAVMLVMPHTVVPHSWAMGHHFIPLPGPAVMPFPICRASRVPARISNSKAVLGRLSNVIRPSTPLRWFFRWVGVVVCLWYAKKLMSLISKGASSGRAVATIWFRVPRTLCLVRVRSRVGGTAVVMVWAKWMAIELSATQVLWPMTGASFA